MDEVVTLPESEASPPLPDSVTVRFAGDSGDGIQLTGARFALSCALAGNDLRTFPDFPAEIRAPAGKPYGVSAFQIQFGTRRVSTPGEEADVLVALNPAALKVSLDFLSPSGLLIVNKESFTDRNLAYAGYESNPLEDGSLASFRLLTIDMSRHTLEALEALEIGHKDAKRCKNMWALGLVYWLFSRDRQSTIDWLKNKFREKPVFASATVAALNAGHIWAETAELSPDIVKIKLVDQQLFTPGLYRHMTGDEAVALGLYSGAQLAGLGLIFCSYPITPASQLLHRLATMDEPGLSVFQAEDEIAAICAALGASFAGSIGVSSSSGPGLSLKSEALGLAIATELPLVLVNAQRGGPSTGLPTRTEQSDLLQAMFGRHGDAPLAVLAARSPSDAFDCAIEAIRIATRYRTPVILLLDGYIMNAAEPWLLPDMAEYKPFPLEKPDDASGQNPFARNAEGVRPWIPAGTKGGAFRVGGIEKDFDSGAISYDGLNHQRMTELRARKIEQIKIPAQKIEAGPSSGRLAVVGWGSTHGAIEATIRKLGEENKIATHIHLRHLNPFPANLGAMLKQFDQILVPELNNGQLAYLLRSAFLLPVQSYNHIQGTPLPVAKLREKILALLSEDDPAGEKSRAKPGGKL